MILSKSVVNNMKKNYYYNIFLGKALYKNKSNAEYFTWMFEYINFYIFQ